MSDKSELQQRAEEVLVDLINKAAEIGSAAVDEIPLVVQELLLWKLTESLLYCLFAIILFSMSFFWGKFIINNSNDIGEDATACGLLLSAIVAAISVLIFDIDWLQIWIAPRVYLLEYAASLVK